jgi:hypothetical protein
MVPVCPKKNFHFVRYYDPSLDDMRGHEKTGAPARSHAGRTDDRLLYWLQEMSRAADELGASTTTAKCRGSASGTTNLCDPASMIVRDVA